jgi:hypothetical protein
MPKPPIPLFIQVGSYYVTVQFAPRWFIKKRFKHQCFLCGGMRKKKAGGVFDGAWDNQLGESDIAGIVYIDKALPLKKKWRTLLHELQHVMIDLHDWDWEN